MVNVGPATTRHETTPTTAGVPPAVLTFTSGQRVRLDRNVVIGRQPSIGGDVPTSPARLVTLCDPTVSRVHALVEVEPWQCSIRDLGSTNGTTVHRPDHPPRRLTFGETSRLEPGDRVDLGAGIGFTLEVDGR